MPVTECHEAQRLRRAGCLGGAINRCAVGAARAAVGAATVGALWGPSTRLWWPFLLYWRHDGLCLVLTGGRSHPVFFPLLPVAWAAMFRRPGSCSPSFSIQPLPLI